MTRFSVIAAILLASALMPSAHAANECRYLDVPENDLRLEWIEKLEPKGARLAADGAGWHVVRTHASMVLGCEACGIDRSLSGFLRFGLPPFMTEKATDDARSQLGMQGVDRLEFAVQPEVVALGLMGFNSDLMRRIDLKAAGESQAIRIAGVVGRARVLFHVDGGRLVHAVAVALEEGCFSLSGIFWAPDGRLVSIDELKFLDATIVVENYKPVVDPSRTRSPSSPPKCRDGTILEILRDGCTPKQQR